MKVLILTALALGMSFAQRGGSSAGANSGAPLPSLAPDPPNQAELAAIAQKEHKKNVADAGMLLRLATQLKTDIESQGHETVSATAVKEAEQIEKLAHGLRNRLKH
jgi:hypothetical protein